MFETLIPLSSDVNIFSIVELLTNSVHDPKSTDIATDCGARIYTYVIFFSNKTLKRTISIEFKSSKLRSKFCFLTPTVTNLENILDAAKVT